EVWVRGAVRTIPYDVFALPFVFLLAWSYSQYGAPVVFLFLFPIFGLRQLYKQKWELEQTNEELLLLGVSTFEAGDRHTSGHSQRVAEYALKIGRILNLRPGELDRLRIAALLHDVGKIAPEFRPV